MPTVPRSKEDAIEWFDQRAQTWLARAGQLGLTDAQAAQLVALTDAARTDRIATASAVISADNALVTEDTSIAAMRALGATIIGSIRAHANQQSDPNAVLVLASIPPTAPKSPQPPEVPYGLSATLGNDGALSITWKGRSNGGTAVYAIERSLQPCPHENSSGHPDARAPLPFEQIAIVGDKVYVDDSIPPGTVFASYRIRAHKGRHVSEHSASLVVHFTPIAAPRFEIASAA